MRYGIIANPASGKMSLAQKRSELLKVSEILDAEIYGLDTVTPEDFSQCARELAARCDILVTAGGDGTFSDIINSIDTAQTPIAFIPLGTGNAMRHALKYKGSLAEIAMRIRAGQIHQYDLINCQEKRRGFMISVGIEGTIIRLRDRYLAKGYTGLKPYFWAFVSAYFRHYRRTIAEISVDETTFEVKNLLSLMIVKQPYYGFGMKVVPKARFNDRLLHVLCVNSGLFRYTIGVSAAFTIGNRVGQYLTAHQLAMKLAQPLTLQVDGNAAWDGDAFVFNVLPKALKIKC